MNIIKKLVFFTLFLLPFTVAARVSYQYEVEPQQVYEVSVLVKVKNNKISSNHQTDFNTIFNTIQVTQEAELISNYEWNNLFAVDSIPSEIYFMISNNDGKASTGTIEKQRRIDHFQNCDQTKKGAIHSVSYLTSCEMKQLDNHSFLEQLVNDFINIVQENYGYQYYWVIEQSQYGIILAGFTNGGGGIFEQVPGGKYERAKYNQKREEESARSANRLILYKKPLNSIET